MKDRRSSPALPVEVDETARGLPGVSKLGGRNSHHCLRSFLRFIRVFSGLALFTFAILLYLVIVGTLFAIALAILAHNKELVPGFWLGILLGVAAVLLPKKSWRWVRQITERRWLVVAIASETYSIYLALSSGVWGLLILTIPPAVWLSVAWALAQRKETEEKEIVGLLWGLGIGGTIWLTMSSFVSGSASHWLKFLQDHAFDYLTAGGIGALALYCAGRSSWRFKKTIATFALAITGSLTAFSAGGDWKSIVAGAIVGGLIGRIAIASAPHYTWHAVAQSSDAPHA